MLWEELFTGFRIFPVMRAVDFWTFLQFFKFCLFYCVFFIFIILMNVFFDVDSKSTIGFWWSHIVFEL